MKPKRIKVTLVIDTSGYEDLSDIDPGMIAYVIQQHLESRTRCKVDAMTARYATLSAGKKVKPLDAVSFEGWFHDAAPDTDGRDSGVLGWNQHVVVIFLVGQRVPAVKPNQIVQSSSIAKPDSSVLEKRAV